MGNDFTGQAINVDAAFAENLDSVVAIEHRPVRPSLERSRLTRF